jgi:hypothetical protein
MDNWLKIALAVYFMVACFNYIQLATGNYRETLKEVNNKNPDESNSIEEDWVLSLFIVVISIPIALLWPFTLTYRLGKEDQE